MKVTLAVATQSLPFQVGGVKLLNVTAAKASGTTVSATKKPPHAAQEPSRPCRWTAHGARSQSDPVGTGNGSAAPVFTRAMIPRFWIGRSASCRIQAPLCCHRATRGPAGGAVAARPSGHALVEHGPRHFQKPAMLAPAKRSPSWP